MTRSSKTPPRRRQRIAALISTGILLAGVGVLCTPSTDASWTQQNYHGATMSTGTIYPVTSVTCGAAAGLLATAIPLSWTEPATTGNGLAPTGYTVSWSGSAGSGSTTVAAPALTATVPGSVLSLLGTSTVVVYANYGTWQSTVSTQTRTISTISALGVIVSWTCA